MSSLFCLRFDPSAPSLGAKAQPFHSAADREGMNQKFGHLPYEPSTLHFVIRLAPWWTPPPLSVWWGTLFNSSNSLQRLYQKEKGSIGLATVLLPTTTIWRS